MVEHLVYIQEAWVQPPVWPYSLGCNRLWALRPELPSYISVTLERSSYDTCTHQNITNPYIAITSISQHRLTSHTVNTHVRGSSVTSRCAWPSRCPRTEHTRSRTRACHTKPLATTANPSCGEHPSGDNDNKRPRLSPSYLNYTTFRQREGKLDQLEPQDE